MTFMRFDVRSREQLISEVEERGKKQHKARGIVQSTVVSINFLGFFVDEEAPQYLWEFGFVEKRKLSYTMVKEVEIYFIELPKFKKLFEDVEPEQLSNDLEKWLYFFVLCYNKDKLNAFLQDTKDEVFLENEKKIE